MVLAYFIAIFDWRYYLLELVQSTEAVEYTDCLSAET